MACLAIIALFVVKMNNAGFVNTTAQTDFSAIICDVTPVKIVLLFWI
jgi:hypothetical protein